MVCPLRVVIFAVSCAVITAALLSYASGSEIDVMYLERHKQRSWWGFLKSLFSGELVYEAWYGPGSWNPSYSGCDIVGGNDDKEKKMSE